MLQEILLNKLHSPDKTNVYTHGDYTFVYNLIHLICEIVMQPYVQGPFACIFRETQLSFYNGEESRSMD